MSLLFPARGLGHSHSLSPKGSYRKWEWQYRVWWLISCVEEVKEVTLLQLLFKCGGRLHSPTISFQYCRGRLVKVRQVFLNINTKETINLAAIPIILRWSYWDR